MEPRAFYVLGKQSNTELDAQPLNLCFAVPQKWLKIWGNWGDFTSKFVNINDNYSGLMELKKNCQFCFLF